jgi:hypothetical protein
MIADFAMNGGVLLRSNSLSRLRGKAGVGVSPRFALVLWRDFPHPDRIMRCDPTSPASGRGKTP